MTSGATNSGANGPTSAHEEDTGALYDAHAARWERREPSSLSDFTGRPAVFDLCGPLEGVDVIDLGCGEGYCTRELVRRGARSVTGVELSEKMVELARSQEIGTAESGSLGSATFRQGDITRLDEEDGSFDLALAVFVYNYLDTAQMLASFREAHRVLRPGGRFVFSVPHPAFAFIRDENAAPFYFDVDGKGYFSGRDRKFRGEINRRDGTALPVQMVHKTFGDYFDGLREAGFTRLPEVRELAVLPEHLELDPDFFSPVADLPLHVALRLER